MAVLVMAVTAREPFPVGIVVTFEVVFIVDLSFVVEATFVVESVVDEEFVFAIFGKAVDGGIGAAAVGMTIGGTITGGTIIVGIIIGGTTTGGAIAVGAGAGTGTGDERKTSCYFQS